MPHQCTNCDLTFEDGSKQMLGGCPECGGNKFQFLPSSATKRDSTDGTTETTTSSATDPESSAEPTVGSRTEPLAAGSTGGSPGDADDIIEAPAEPVEAVPDGEDRAQASARSAVVSEDELSAASTKAEPATVPDEPTEPEPEAADEEDGPDLSQLRKELNDQFESIKILQPGEYELNLMELYDRQEYIIALEEDGRYVIDVPDARLSED